MEALRKIADGLIGLSAAIGSLGLLVVVGVILVDVIGRAFGSPLFGSQDMVTMGMVIIVFGGMALCDRTGGHVAVDVFENHFPRGFNRAVDVIAALLGAIIFFGIAWTIWESSQISRMLNLSTNLLRLPKAWFQWALMGFAIVTALGMLLRAAELAFRGRDIRGESHSGEEPL
ncbi:TRAP transporter small permease [Pseudoruegeria sp. HB172150]|uniref:TRAP transporter small permease n=1 Tax=Pseudoruegeria sp. HB172150 TaxID=2721164 RepID=UPI00155530A8|nr:TRAP transporter small permease [Pseudoruegeria sp. HB172150]